jgi:hypothetical protein
MTLAASWTVVIRSFYFDIATPRPQVAMFLPFIAHFLSAAWTTRSRYCLPALVFQQRRCYVLPDLGTSL